MPILGASVIGTSHIRAGMPCQDAHAILRLNDGTTIAALADGAGSAPRSQEGAALIVSATIAAVQAVLAWQNAAHTNWRLTFGDVFEAVLGGAHAYAGNMRADASAFASTLLCVVAWQGGAAAAHVGDGALVVRHADGSLATALSPNNGEYANETVFLTTRHALEAMQVFDSAAQPITGFCAMSDGLTRLALQLPAHTPHANFFAPLFAFISQPGATQADLEEFLSSPRVCARSDDDKTLILCAEK